MATRLRALALATLLAGCAASGEDATGELARREPAAARAGQRGEGPGLPAQMRGRERRLAIDPSSRHASAHLVYQPPAEVSQSRSWYMSMTAKHSSEDTFFAVLGHQLGYMGLQQVEERGLWFQGKAIFSIWDQGCNHLMDPGACPESQRAEVVECGRHALCTSFGGEGTGMKSYIDFHEWDLEEPYGFLVQAFDEGSGKARYEGYFHAPELGGWVLLAKLRVNLGGKSWPITSPYSFVEQWSTRSGEDIRFGRFGPSFMEPVTAAEGDWHNWRQVMQATFSHTDGHNEVAMHLHANVTGGGMQWGLGLGGDLQRGIHEGDVLTIDTPFGQGILPQELLQWVQLRLDHQLPGGCPGQTCLDTMILAWPRSAFTKKYIPVTILALTFFLACCLACCCWLVRARVPGKAMPGGRGSPADQNLQRAQLMAPAPGQSRYGYEQPRFGYEQPRYGYEQAAGLWGGRGSGPAGRPQTLEREPLVQMPGRAR